MQVNMGSKIKQLRLKNDLTQEGLAEVLGVSPQAISRWEKGKTYPDINMIPSLATFFKVSTDDLFNMAYIRNEKELVAYHTQVHGLIRESKVEEAILILRQALKKYPNDFGFMCELSQALTLYQDFKVSEEALKEAADLSERILNDCLDDKIRSGIKANLCFIYLKQGQVNKAQSLAKTLPHIWESREMITPNVTQDSVNINLLKTNLHLVLTLISNKIDSATNPVPDEPTQTFILGPQTCENKDINTVLRQIKHFLES